NDIKKTRKSKQTKKQEVVSEEEKEDEEEDEYEEEEEDDDIKKEDPLTHLKRIKLVNGKDTKSMKFRDPSDMQQSEQRISKRIRKNPTKKIGPLNVLPRRENQNEY